jgi:hypothetical protein
MQDRRPSRKEDVLAPRRLRLAVATALATAATALLAAPAGAAVHVETRVEGPVHTLFQGVVVPKTGTVSDSNGDPHTTPTPTPLGAVLRASELKGFPVRLSWFDCCGGGWSGLFVDSVNAKPGDASHFWALKLNHKLAGGGAGAITATEGMKALFYYTRLNTRTGATQPTLGIVSSASAVKTKQRVTIQIYKYDDKARRSNAAGATVWVGSVGVHADSSGRATVSFATTGRKAIRATLSGAIRSKTLWVDVT